MIDTIGNAELKNKEEDLLKNMKMLRHTVADMLGSKSFLKDINPGAQNGIIGIDGETFPVYITANTLAADGLPEITDDIYDEDNYLSLISDDDLMWYALVEHLGTKMENLWKENEELKDEKNQLREELTAADNEIEGLEQSLREANQACTEYVHKIDEFENENKRLSERVRTLVCEKCNGKDLPLKFGEQERGTPEDKVVRMDIETALMQQQIANLNTRIAQLEEKLKSTEAELTTANNANGILKTKIAALADEKREAELLAYRLTRGEMHVQFDNMKSLEHENGVLKNENADLNMKLLDTYKAHDEESEDDLRKRIAEYAQKNDDLLERNKRLNREINKFRVQLNSYSGATVVNNEDMQQKITQETMAELTAKINELEEKLKDKDERIDQLSKNNAALSTENKNFGDLLKEADRTARFYAREVDNLEKEIKDLKSEAAKSVLEPHEVTANDGMSYTVSLETMNQLTARTKELESINENLREEIEKIKHENEDFERVAAAHLETTAKFAEYKDKQKRLYKHFKNLAEMIEDLMELG